MHVHHLPQLATTCFQFQTPLSQRQLTNRSTIPHSARTFLPEFRRRSSFAPLVALHKERVAHSSTPASRFATFSVPSALLRATFEQDIFENMSTQPVNKPPFKRLCIFSDGSWKDPEIEVPTNIVCLANAVKLHDEEGIPQIVFYDAGVGTSGDFLSQLRGGAFGEGIDLNMMELYTFLAMNYDEGDEVYLFGYSRGAYTVRSLAGFIHEAGLVRRGHLNFVKEAYDLYRSDKAVDSVDAVNFRETHGGSVPIKLLACFDTVGSLGLPFEVPWPFSWLFDTDRYRFHNTVLSESIENAVHALSIDEDRTTFLPTPMDCNKRRGPEQVTQLFMPGFHGGVGGGSRSEKPLSENACRFVVDEMKRRGIGLAFDMEKVPKGDNCDIPPREPDGFFSMHNILKTFTGAAVRDIQSVDLLHPVALKRFAMVEEWRPASLKKFERQILERMLRPN